MIMGGNYIKYVKTKEGNWAEEVAPDGCKSYYQMECYKANYKNLNSDNEVYVMDGDDPEQAIEKILLKKEEKAIRVKGLEKELDYINDFARRRREGKV